MSALLDSGSTLYDAALRLPRIGQLRGRGVAIVAELAGDLCVVRHYERGGAIASVLGDRYARPARNRVAHEVAVSEHARSRGVPTPRVKCGAWYTHGFFRRFDIATEFIADSQDLASVLFGDVAPGEPVLRQTAELVRTMLRAGLVHEDLNAKNILVTHDRAYVLDLDRCHMRDRVTDGDVRRMRERFFRSVNKWETLTGTRVHDVARNVLSEAFHA